MPRVSLRRSHAPKWLLSLLKAALFAMSLPLGSAQAAPYTVRAGDTLWSIAQQASATVEALRAASGLSSDTLQVGQVLTLPDAPSSNAPASGGNRLRTALVGLTVEAPRWVREGDGFTLRLSGPGAETARVRFPSELKEDVRQPNEWLSPQRIGGEWVILGRVVLGQTAPVRFELQAGAETAEGQITVTPLGQPVQNLNMPASIAGVLKDPGHAAETAAVEEIYRLRGAPLWSSVFAPALRSTRRSSGFGQPRRERAGGPISYHFGLDYPAAAGTRVQAVNRGRVVLAARYPVRGNLVAIDHGAGLVSMYFHLSKIGVKVGQMVEKGQDIGEVGSTGYSTGPHLHLEMRLRGEGINPAGLLGGLLP